MDAEIPSQPPAGFFASTTRGPFSTRNGPYFHKVETGSRFWHGVRVQGRHCNALGSLHGGMMSAHAGGLLARALVPLGMVRRLIWARDQRYIASVSSQ